MKQIVASCLALVLSVTSAWAGLTPEQAAKVLSVIPATDPVVTNPPQIVDALKNVHPRLMFSQGEMDALKARIGSDPTLQKGYEGTVFWAKAVSFPPSILTGDQDALVKSYSQAPALAYAYALDHDPATREEIIRTLTQMVNAPHWADGTELDSSMGAACNMFMTALLFDAAYNDLEPALRNEVAAKLLTQARRLYYLGHKGMLPPYPGKGYWMADPQPNHRWYRDMGLAACVLAIAGEKDIDTGYLLQGLKDEMDLVAKWYPADGDCHEGTGYQSFGITAISSAFTMMDRNLGTTYLKDSGLRHAWEQQLYFWVPGRMSDISWGDDQNGADADFGHNDATFFLGPKLSRDPQAQAAMLLKMNKAITKSGGKPPIMPWTLLAFFDPSLVPGDLKTIPLVKLLPDIGAASMRDSWEGNAVVFTFKCGPYGGYQLNQYRNTTTDNGQPHYVNVAHDDPDANEFALAVGNGFAFHPGNYTSPDHSKKLSGDHSTITVDDKGQVGEGGGYTQPVGNENMTTFSYLTGWKSEPTGRVIIEGEAGPSYCGQTYAELRAANNKLAPSLLKSYRRTAIWMPKDYILILDNIVSADGPHKITWHGSTPVSQIADGKGIATTETGIPVPFQIVSDQPVQSASVPMTLVGRWGNDPIQQIQVTAQAAAVKFATVLDPWKTNPTVKLTSNTGITTVEVSGTGYDDIWTWQNPQNTVQPSAIEGKRAGAPLVSLTESDRGPRK